MSEPLKISEAGRCLYGPNWQSDLARALGLSIRMVQRYAAGETQPGPHTWARVAKLLRDRQLELAQVWRRIPQPRKRPIVPTDYRNSADSPLIGDEDAALKWRARRRRLGIPPTVPD